MKKSILLSGLVWISIFTFTSCGGDETSIPKIDFSLNASSVLEGSDITVAFSKSLPSGVTPTISLSGTATENTDFTYSITTAGVAFTTIDDGEYDPNETIILTLTGFNKGAVVGTKVVHTITITETPIVVEFASQSATRIEGQSLVMSFATQLADAVVPTFTVTGTATNVTDYTYVQNNNGFTITVKKDELYDPNETVIIELTGVSGNAELGVKKTYTLTISDEDETAEAGLKIDLTWESLDNPPVSDVDMDLLVWLETSEGVYTSTGWWSNEPGFDPESAFIPVSATNGKYAFSYVYYSGASNNLKVKVDFRSYKGNINGTSNRASYDTLYTSANINAYDPITYPSPMVVAQTLEKVSNNFINLSDFSVAPSGSRTRSVTFILDDKTRRNIEEKIKRRSGRK